MVPGYFLLSFLSCVFMISSLEDILWSHFGDSLSGWDTDGSPIITNSNNCPNSGTCIRLFCNECQSIASIGTRATQNYQDIRLTFAVTGSDLNRRCSAQFRIGSTSGQWFDMWSRQGSFRTQVEVMFKDAIENIQETLFIRFSNEDNTDEGGRCFINDIYLYGTPITTNPTNNPTDGPTNGPTDGPTDYPTKKPSKLPTNYPSMIPSKNPSRNPTSNTSNPTKKPSITPSLLPTLSPTLSPTISPTLNPSHTPTVSSISPSLTPTIKPSNSPTKTPTISPSNVPTNIPTESPSKTPTFSPTNIPTSTPTSNPTIQPSITPTKSTKEPTISPTIEPTTEPTVEPTNVVIMESTTNIDTENNINNANTFLINDQGSLLLVFAICGFIILLICLLVVLCTCIRRWFRYFPDNKEDSLPQDRPKISKLAAPSNSIPSPKMGPVTSTPMDVINAYKLDAMQKISYFIDDNNSTHTNSDKIIKGSYKTPAISKKSNASQEVIIYHNVSKNNHLKSPSLQVSDPKDKDGEFSDIKIDLSFSNHNNNRLNVTKGAYVDGTIGSYKSPSMDTLNTLNTEDVLYLAEEMKLEYDMEMNQDKHSYQGKTFRDELSVGKHIDDFIMNNILTEMDIDLDSIQY